MSLKKETLSGVVWTTLQQFSNRIVSFVVTLILSRLLFPEDFGTIAVFGVFMGIVGTIIDGGLTSSIIRSDNIDDEDLSTVFYFNIVASSVLYIVMFFCSPLIASFYKMPELTLIIRVFSVRFIIGSFGAIQNTLLTKEMNFKKMFYIGLPGLIVNAVVGVVMAYMGFGVWSLVFNGIASGIVGSTILWLTSDWRPKFVFNKTKFKYHFSFGYKLTLSSMLDTMFSNIYTIVIGKLFKPYDVGLVDKASGLRMLPIDVISSPLNRVTYPLFAKIKNDNVALRNVYTKLMKTVIYMVAPMMIGMAVLSVPIFRFLFTEKWVPAAPYFCILCISGILYPIHAYNLNILQVKGRSDLFLSLEIIKKCLTVLALFLTFRFGIKAMLWGSVVNSVLALGINSYHSGKFIKYNIFYQIIDMMPSIIVASVMGLLVWFLDNSYFFEYSDLFRIVVSSAIGCFVYWSISYIFRLKELDYVMDLFKLGTKKIINKNN